MPSGRAACGRIRWSRSAKDGPRVVRGREDRKGHTRRRLATTRARAGPSREHYSPVAPGDRSRPDRQGRVEQVALQHADAAAASGRLRDRSLASHPRLDRSHPQSRKVVMPLLGEPQRLEDPEVGVVADVHQPDVQRAAAQPYAEVAALRGRSRRSETSPATARHSLRSPRARSTRTRRSRGRTRSRRRSSTPSRRPP